MTNRIVQVNVSQEVGAAPNNLQQTGAFVSQGGTTLTPGTFSLLTQLSDLTPLLSGGVTISSLTWSSGVATATLSGPSGIPSGDTLPGTIAGVTPAGWNAADVACTYVSADVFTYPLASNPGTPTLTAAVFSLEDVGELTAMATTFFAQGNSLGVYVLELGAGTTAQGVTALNTYIADPTLEFYSYLVPSEWGNEATFPAMIHEYQSTTSKTYFFVTLTLENYTNFLNATTGKALFGVLQSPSAPSTEFSAAAMFWVTLSYAPTDVNKVTPLSFAFLSDVTAYSALTGPQQTALKAAFMNWVGTGAEGGISNNLILWGTTGDGNPFNYWYSVDWVQINVDLDLSNAIINGSNNPQAPLYYNQDGINYLKKVAQGTMNRGVTFGLILNTPPVTVTAVPFVTYVADNPSDYPEGIYRGLAVSYTPARGFEQIIFNIEVANFVLS